MGKKPHELNLGVLRCFQAFRVRDLESIQVFTIHMEQKSSKNIQDSCKLMWVFTHRRLVAFPKNLCQTAGPSSRAGLLSGIQWRHHQGVAKLDFDHFWFSKLEFPCDQSRSRMVYSLILYRQTDQDDGSQGSEAGNMGQEKWESSTRIFRKNRVLVDGARGK